MKPRHVAALALVGWYLMVPPPCADHRVFLTCRESGDPVGQWTIRDKFDTEQECNEKLRSWRGHTRPLTVCAGLDCWSSLTPFQRQIVNDQADADSAKCISTDDPHLKAKYNGHVRPRSAVISQIKTLALSNSDTQPQIKTVPFFG